MLCGSCGQQNAEGAAHCWKCGAALAAPAAASPAGPVYAGFWRRFAAVAIDYVILIALSALIAGMVGAVYGLAAGDPDRRVAEGLGHVTGILVWWLYYALMESSARQATLGKMALGIKVVDLDGSRIGFVRASGRHFGKILSGLILMIGYLLAGLTSRRQALHDMLAGCLVVRRAVGAEGVKGAAPAPTFPLWASAAIVIAVAVVPVALVAAVFVPAYQDRVVRMHMTVAVQSGEEAARAVAQFHERHKAFPSTLAEAGYQEAGGGATTLQLDPRTGAVRVVLAEPRRLAGRAIVLTPSVEGGRIAWACSGDGIQPRHLPSRCRR